jgi:hypothetical protein
MNETDRVTIFGAVDVSTLNKVRAVIRLSKRRRIMLSQKELVGQIVERFIDQVLEEANQQSLPSERS